MLDVSPKTAERLIRKAMQKFLTSNFDSYDTVWDTRMCVIGHEANVKDYASIVVEPSHMEMTFSNISMQKYAAYASYHRITGEYKSDMMPELIMPFLKEFVLATELIGLQVPEVNLQ